MPTLLIVNNKEDFKMEIPGVQVITAREYLTDPRFMRTKKTKVFNLCSTLRYQGDGYYISLLAAARGHRAMPEITTIQDTKTHSIVRLKSDELEPVIQRSLAGVDASEFSLDVYFGKSIEPAFQQLGCHLFQQFRAPLLRAQFLKNNGKWQLNQVGILPASELCNTHEEHVAKFAADFFSGKRFSVKRQPSHGYEMAILVDHEEQEPPSNKIAIRKFIRAAASYGINATIITKDDYNHLGEYDALFIRETTNVNHYTYRFARRAAVEGLVVMDDPESILKCSNKVYLAELLTQHKVPTPETMIISKDNADKVKDHFSFPIILKLPDSAFSKGVKKVKTEEELNKELKSMLERSELIIAQEFLPTSYDWRIGVLDRKPLFACKYYMAGKHWQIINCEKKGNSRYGKAETFALEDVPQTVLDVAVKAANLIGDGLYGVDIKELDGKAYVIEVNDNPNIDTGVEDKILKDNLYNRIMEVFLERIQNTKKAGK
jgi:glutathione synthase/RimK-type ligase-like ATP-grasp enzyme